MERPDRDLRWLRRSYRSFRLLNQFYARYRLVLERWLVTPMLAAPGQTYRIADLGSGAGDLAAWLARRCQELGLPARVCGLDNDAQAVAFARERYPDVEYRQQDALAAGALAEFDFVIANHVLHHFSDTELASFLWELGRLPLRGFVLSDLKRSYCAYYAHSVVGLFFPGTYVGVDGRLSLRRGFTVRVPLDS